jgi:CBS domain-containing protein
MPTRNVPMAEAGPRVEDVMLRGPRTYAPETTVAEARAEFENPRVRLLLLARADTFAGAVTRESVGDDLPGDMPLGELAARDGWQVSPGDPVARAVELLDAEQADRLPVVAGDGALVGLVCFNRRHGHFCVDA